MLKFLLFNDAMVQFIEKRISFSITQGTRSLLLGVRLKLEALTA